MKTIIISLLFTVSSLAAVGQTQTYCTNIDGNIACNSFNHEESSQSYCTSISGNLSCTTFDTNHYDRVVVLQNYEAGRVIGTALGNAVVAAVEACRANKRAKQAKQDVWEQFLQDTLAKSQLSCETEETEEVRKNCRSSFVAFSQFLHRHPKDFVADGHNLNMLSDAMVKSDDSHGITGAAEYAAYGSEQAYEVLFQTIDKKKLDKKIYIGTGNNRRVW